MSDAPMASTGLTDKMVLDLAKDLDDKKIDSLGEALDLGAAEVSRIKDNNQRSAPHPAGTISMLHTWRDSKVSAQQVPELRKALNAAGLAKLAEKHLLKQGISDYFAHITIVKLFLP